jgi:hypothetical protein
MSADSLAARLNAVLHDAGLFSPVDMARQLAFEAATESSDLLNTETD